MHIPAPAQDLHLPLTLRQEASPVLPVTAVPGLPEQAQSLDSRVALQWAQPVFQGHSSQSTRTALTAPLSVTGFEPQGADPDALSAGRVHPLLAQGLASWLSRALAEPGQSALPAGPLSTATVHGDMDLALFAGRGSVVMPMLLGLYRALAFSDVFAAQRLSECWLPGHAGDKRPGVLLKNRDADIFQALARPVDAQSDLQIAQWVAALEPDSESAEQAARMLNQGQMLWQTELAPGVPMRMVREDAWRGHPFHPGQLEKGATLRVEIDLPRLGHLRIVGSQWAGDVSLQIEHDCDANGNWSVLTAELVQDLLVKGVCDVHVTSAPEDAGLG